MLDLEPIKTRARAPQAAEFLVNAVDDIEALVEEVERLRLTLRTVLVKWDDYDQNCFSLGFEEMKEAVDGARKLLDARS